MKLKLLLIALVMCILTGCSSPKPEKTVNLAMDAYKAANIQDMSQYFTNGLPEFLSSYAKGSESSEDDELFKDAAEFLSIFFKVDYEIKETTINDNLATVSLNLKTYNIGDKLNEGLTNAMQILFSNMFSNISEEEMEKQTQEAFLNSLKYAEKNKDWTVDVKLTKVDGKWLINTKDNDQFMNALTGGLWEFKDKIEAFSQQ